MMTSEEISKVIVSSQNAEVKAMKRARSLRDKANDIINKAGGENLLNEAQKRNVESFREIANEIEGLNLAKNAEREMYIKQLEPAKKSYMRNKTLFVLDVSTKLMELMAEEWKTKVG